MTLGGNWRWNGLRSGQDGPRQCLFPGSLEHGRSLARLDRYGQHGKDRRPLDRRRHIGCLRVRCQYDDDTAIGKCLQPVNGSAEIRVLTRVEQDDLGTGSVQVLGHRVD